jgi:hypothetical protein
LASQRTSSWKFISTKKVADVELRSQPYRAGDKVLEWGKILLRLDAWDREHYPHTVD